MLSDEQFAELVSKVTGAIRPTRSRWGRLIDAAASAAMVALVLGFFGTMWNTATGWRDSLQDLDDKTTETARELKNTQDVLAQEFAKLKACADLLVVDVGQLKTMLSSNNLQPSLPVPESDPGNHADPENPVNPGNDFQEGNSGVPNLLESHERVEAIEQEFSEKIQSRKAPFIPRKSAR